MTLRVPLNHPNRSMVLDHFISSSREVVSDVSADVAQIIATIRKEGDKALLQYTKAFDHFSADDMTALSVPSSQLKQAYEQLDKICGNRLIWRLTGFLLFMNNNAPQHWNGQIRRVFIWGFGIRRLMRRGFMFRVARRHIRLLS